ncbi:MFS transporter [Sulfolobus acidocaldarius]|uniref:Transporter protein n=4 Tax=Sulfolobus acidocaldarius TaxID=2285 RepID=Q4J6L4_SULAC|nr:MFS transporter [Sulfolobus acidocaldarius]AAY81568.1 transporter protein [Sulfolobus acidocaldarius DSM 639]AGE72171.1 transporter protein [Sulfolobus acidocaldarius N8]AGE74488.1 transporter protein [Sulfolobus acidocaldarius Ron12/I]ALU29657.1 transporter [Sulfolobus acidocaldarius]ALU32392.1 transporter [Sulfolobus acidocaldarius]
MESWTREAKLALTSQFLGFMLDAYDLLFVSALTPYIEKNLVPPGLTGLVGYFVTLALGLGLTLIGRPLGSAIFGNFGDVWGRRRTLMITIIGFSVFSALIGLLPTYAAIGIAASILYAVLRFIEGIFVGGEYAVGHPFAIEYAPSKWRGLVSGIAQGAFSWGTAIGAGIVYLFISVLGDKAMSDYGWRLVFFTGLIPAAVAFIIRYLVPETPVFRKALSERKLERIPFFSLFRPPTLYTFLNVFVLMTGLFFSSYSLFDFATGILTKAGLSTQEASLYYSLAGVFAAIAATLWGLSSDFIGRKKAFLIAAIVTIILATPSFYLWYNAAKANDVGLLFLGSFLIGWLTQWPWGLVPVYLSERFITKRRASGVGFGYSSGVFISAWMPIYSIPLSAYFAGIEGGDPWFVAAFFLILAAVIYGIAALIGPETRTVDLYWTEESEKIR